MKVTGRVLLGEKSFSKAARKGKNDSRMGRVSAGGRKGGTARQSQREGDRRTKKSCKADYK